MESSLYGMQQFYGSFQEAAISTKIERGKRKKQLLQSMFGILCFVLDLPLYTKDIELKSTEFVGDFLKDLYDHKNALFYYVQTVS